MRSCPISFFFFQAEDGIRDHCVTGVQTCALPISVGVGSLSPPPLARRRDVPTDGPKPVRTHSLNQSLKLRITVGISRSLPKSLDAIGPNPPEPSDRVKPFRKNGGS